MNIVIINGPNLNLLGEREPKIYGKETLKSIEKKCKEHAKKNKIKVDFFQSNIEGEIVTKIQKSRDKFDGLIINAAEVEIVTVAVRRVNVTNPKEPMLVDFLDPKKITYLPNTAGCYTAEEALRTLRLARDAGGWNLVKLEVLGDKETLYPNMIETIEALKVLKKENFEVMVYTSDDPILCKQLEDMGAAAIMPLGSLIGSGRGIQNRFNISIIKTQSKVPVIVDAGIGCASDAAIAMELGCDGVLINTAVAEAKNPILMAEAMKDAVIAGRKSFIAGRIKKKVTANPSSPFEGLIE